MDYQNGKIYKIWNEENDKVYIGSTTQPLYKRFSKHKEFATEGSQTKGHYRLYKAMKEIGKDLFHIELVEAFPCNNKDELTAREGVFIRQFDSFNKEKGYNGRIEGRSKQEYLNDNRDKKNAYDKDRRKKKFTCTECGSKNISYAHKSEHNHSMKHQNCLSVRMKRFIETATKDLEASRERLERDIRYVNSLT